MASSRSPLTAVPDDPSARAQLASWYAQGPSDGFGDRLLMFDNAATGPLELLRVRPDFSFVPDFEASVRARFERLLSLNHRGFAQTRAVNHLDNGEGLTVVSAHVPGTRLSELFESKQPHAGMHPVSVRWALGELVSAMAELHRQDREIAHGALAPERIVITADHHLVITDYVFGDALENLKVPADRLWTEFGIVSASSTGGALALDQRADVVQLGLLVMSLVLGRRVSPTEYPVQLGELLDEFSAAADRRAPDATPALRAFLEQALDPAGFRSATDAELALAHPFALPGPAPAPAQPALRLAPSTPAAPPPEEIRQPRAALLESSIEEDPSPGVVGHTSHLWGWIAAALALLALAQGVLIARLASRPPAATTARLTVDSGTPGDTVLLDGQQVGVTPLELPIGASSRSIRIVSQTPAVAPGAVLAMSQAPSPPPEPAPAARPDVARDNSGGIRIESPIVVQVVEGEKVLGSSANGPVFTTPGVHELDLINNVLGFRTKQTVRVTAGRVIPLQINPPSGTISINAQPWAQVFIDGKAAGDTPIANLSVPLGEHEVVFRHPQLGERRQKAVVQAGALTRVSATFNP
jgi:hypothetical protein